MEDTPHEAERCAEHDWELYPSQEHVDHWTGPCPWCEIKYLREIIRKTIRRIESASSFQVADLRDAIADRENGNPTTPGERREDR